MLGLLRADEIPTHYDESDQAASRLPKGDLAVQVRLKYGGPWHRRLIGGEYTACGARIIMMNSVDSKLRMETYRDHLCTDGCFSQHELALSLDASRVEEIQQKTERERREYEEKMRGWMAAHDEYRHLIKKKDDDK